MASHGWRPGLLLNVCRAQGDPHNTESYQDPNSKSATLRKTQLCPQPSGVRLPRSVTGFLVCIKNMAAFGTREKGFMHFLQPCCF